MAHGNIKIFEIGYCTHPEFMVIRGGGLKAVKFPAMVAFIPHIEGNLLFDTGYGDYFFDVTKQFPEKLYALTTPVTLKTTLKKQLQSKVDFIFISHFHADHIGGLRDFPDIPIFCSKKAYEAAINPKTSRFTKTRSGILPKLLPDDFKSRVLFIETLPLVDLPSSLYPFTKAHLLLNRYYVIELEGHALGQYGLFVENLFFISDAVWDIRSITTNRYPNPLTRFIMDDYKAYIKTLKKLQLLHKNNPAISIIPTHCASTLKPYLNESIND